MALRILFLGENWYGSCARACCYALRRLGCSVCDIDVQTFSPQFRKKFGRALLRIAKPWIASEYNDAVLETATSYQPDFLLAFKAPLIFPETLERLRDMSIRLYNYFPDRMMSALGTTLQKSLPLYDCVFDTKSTWDFPKGTLRLREKVFLPHGYDSEICRPTPPSARDRNDHGYDVLYIATWSPRKERRLHALLEAMPKVDLRIYGNQWSEFCASRLVRSCLAGRAIYADRFATAVGRAKINLGIMGVTESMTDLTTTRTYEIPACGGFMLHERNEEVLRLFNEGEEMACFGSIDELVEKIRFYLAHPEERRRIAAAGHARCVPDYSYDNRMADLLRWHEQHRTEHTVNCIPVINSV